MKIGGRIFQSKNIYANSSDEFHARYKGHDIIITTHHGHGFPKYRHLKRFDITVTSSDGLYAVDTWEDHHEIRSAIISALNGAIL